MTAIDTETLTERIARALDPSSWQLHDSGTFPPEHQASQAVIRRSMNDAAAVLPLVRAAQADALREAAEDLFYDGDRDAPLSGHAELYDRATDYETGDSDEHR